jgi:hypothetical protein
MAAAGVWIVTQDNTGTVYTRHQLTTDMTDVNTREDSMVSNIDSLSYYYLFFFQNARYIGRRNITPGLLAQLEADFNGASTGLISSTSAMKGRLFHEDMTVPAMPQPVKKPMIASTSTPMAITASNDHACPFI